jgi:hypothetical protein
LIEFQGFLHNFPVSVCGWQRLSHAEKQHRILPNLGGILALYTGYFCHTVGQSQGKRWQIMLTATVSGERKSGD